MKSCPTCSRLYPDDAGFCPIDGVGLRPASQVPPALDASDPRIGTTLFGRYQVRRVVADGGMGRVYEALDSRASRAVALKVLHAEVARDAVALERFKREFEISQYLPHEHIVEVFDFQRSEDGAYVLAMDYLEGEELRSVLKREKAIPAERLVRILSQLAMGLDEAHRRQWIHRDLKPDNIFLCGTRDGDMIKLLDFGSVKDKSEGAKKLTVMGTTIGSPFYMSPEQAQGLETLDARADVWALAAIAYEALLGEVPFKGSNGPSILLAILTQSPTPPSKVRSKLAKSPIPEALDDVMDEAFAKNVAMRVGSVGALADKFGQAFGLTGAHRDWAYTALKELAARIAAAAPVARPAAPEPSALGVERDPFADPDPYAARLPPPPPVPVMDPAPYRASPPARAAAALPAGSVTADLVARIPKGPPLALVILAGVIALLLGAGVVAFLIFRHR